MTRRGGRQTRRAVSSAVTAGEDDRCSVRRDLTWSCLTFAAAWSSLSTAATSASRSAEKWQSSLVEMLTSISSSSNNNVGITESLTAGRCTVVAYVALLAVAHSHCWRSGIMDACTSPQRLIRPQSINQFFNYRNVKTHFHMRKTQSSKMYVKSVNRPTNVISLYNILMIKLQSVNREARWQSSLLCGLWRRLYWAALGGGRRGCKTCSGWFKILLNNCLSAVEHRVAKSSVSLSQKPELIIFSCVCSVVTMLLANRQSKNTIKTQTNCHAHRNLSKADKSSTFTIYSIIHRTWWIILAAILNKPIIIIINNVKYYAGIC